MDDELATVAIFVVPLVIGVVGGLLGWYARQYAAKHRKAIRKRHEVSAPHM
ncbi:hypothetical protein [Limobrevibacterium gyesilva]|uniref:Uncharacterized protein n=1 Tax=Limobrevibacterium gyesilva TaxID=2991712 RepID=A0AA41YSG9_9PROT|nr:hypothetical protein [Limobrevibacterium gyesilva]MCW3475690.1 hypothetical protein [Limobrevibacterium gyesilva]